MSFQLDNEPQLPQKKTLLSPELSVFFRTLYLNYLYQIEPHSLFKHLREGDVILDKKGDRQVIVEIKSQNTDVYHMVFIVFGCWGKNSVRAENLARPLIQWPPLKLRKSR